MPFENLSERFQAAFNKLRGKGKLTDEDVNEALNETRFVGSGCQFCRN